MKVKEKWKENGQTKEGQDKTGMNRKNKVENLKSDEARR